MTAKKPAKKNSPPLAKSAVAGRSLKPSSASAKSARRPTATHAARGRSASSVTVRELARNTARVLDDVSRSAKPALVTRNGRVVAAIIPMDAGDLEDYVLAHARQFLGDHAGAADEDLLARRARGAGEVFAELERGGRAPRRRQGRQNT